MTTPISVRIKILSKVDYLSFHHSILCMEERIVALHGRENRCTGNEGHELCEVAGEPGDEANVNHDLSLLDPAISYAVFS